MPASFIQAFLMHHVLSVFFCFLVLTTPVYANDNPCATHQCVAVVDAGSTGSRLHVYSFDDDATNSPVNIKEVWLKKIRPGFASIDPTPAAMNTYLTNLMADAPGEHLPVYFYATAGMRLLPAERQKIYYQGLQNWFNNKPNWQLRAAKTITGRDEALFDWLAVNYHLGTLDSIQTQTVGVMDMGGASVQIVFPIQKDRPFDPKTQTEVTVYGQTIRLYAHSFLGLGQTEMSHQFLNSEPCFANDYPLPDGASGIGNALSCEKEVSSLLNAVHKVNSTVQPLIAANPVDTWYTIGGISNIADNKLFQFDNHQLTLGNLLEQADNQVCHQQWSTLNEQFPDDDYMYEYCLLSAYYYALIVDGYGLKPEQEVNYMPAQQSFDWTTGVVLHREQ